jgi:pyruvate,water dikinase
VARWQAMPWRDMGSGELLDGVRELARGTIDAYGALVSGVLPAAWMSEALFTAVHKVVAGRSAPDAPVYLMGFDSTPIRADKSLYDLAAWAREQPGLAAWLQETPAAEVAAREGTVGPTEVEAEAWAGWKARLATHLERYGHTIYNLDFATPVPADDPAPLLETVKLYLRGEGVDPHQRQRASTERREGAVRETRARLGGLRRRLFERTLSLAQRFAPLREDGLADVGLGYPLLRRMLGELGRRLVEGGAIDAPGDVYWLEEGEAEEAAARLDRGEPLEPLSDRIPERRGAWRAARRVSPPLMLPQLKVLGVDLLALKARGRARRGDTLKGVAASPGTATAAACVLERPEEMARLETGQVLVAAITTPAWTPLFARAGAIVTDVGGPLSHGSIVAREYGIPAVLGTGSATSRIRDGQRVTVDGSAGLVTLHEED